MSQFFINGITSGNIPPQIPTSFVTNSGTAVPAANVLTVLGADGIMTKAAGSTVTVGFIGATGATAGTGITTVVIDSNVTDNATTTYQILIDGYDSGLNEGVGGQIIGTIRKIGGVVTVTGTPDKIKSGEPNADQADYDLVASGGNVAIQYTGAVGTNIAWNAIIAGKTR